jgi:hypothetical protein
MRLSIFPLLLALLFSLSACGQTEGHYVSVRTITDVFFQDTILNIVTSDTTFRDTLLGTGGGGVVGPATQTLDTIDFDFLSTAANLPGATALNPDLTTEIPIPWSTSPVRTSSRYTISGSDISVSATGWYRVSGYLSTNPSTNQRYNGKVFLKKNGTLSDEWTATGYSRASSNQDETTLYFEFYTQLTASVPFQIVQICEGGQLGTNNVTLNNTASRLYVVPLTQNYVELASGPAGAAGTNGLSAYEIWLAQGNAGTQADFLASLEGAQGPVGPSGGPVGPAGPAGAGGAASDTSGNGYFYRLFANDEGDGYPYYDNNANHNFTASGYTGIEFYNPTLDATQRIYTLGVQGFYIEGFTTFEDGFSTDHFQSNSSGGAFGLTGEAFLIVDNAGLRIRDLTPDSLGLVYEQNLSNKLKGNPRSVPDVGTVQLMIDAGGGATPNATYQSISSNTTVTPTAGNMYNLVAPGSGNLSLTINPSSLKVGDQVFVVLSAGGGANNTNCFISATTGAFSGSDFNGGTFLGCGAGQQDHVLTWTGANFHYLSVYRN